MILHVDEADISLVTASQNAIVLGIITGDGGVRLRPADAYHVPGHVEWLARTPIDDVARGFAVLVREGRVSAIFPRSRLNPGPDARLEQELVEQLKLLLPMNEDVRTLE